MELVISNDEIFIPSCSPVGAINEVVSTTYTNVPEGEGWTVQAVEGGERGKRTGDGNG
jgi:hypothetical protein